MCNYIVEDVLGSFEGVAIVFGLAFTNAVAAEEIAFPEGAACKV